ncbi:MAG: acyl-CoA thioesterase [Gammaproteobacteria bacterium]|nr:acyl-CoA thioesterase [Gammaproteobacteria bacterium]
MITNLSAYPIVVDLPVQWGEMDSFGHVNNIMYFRYFEAARIAYLRKIQEIMVSDFLAESGVGIIVGSINAKFIATLVYPDTIQIGAKISSIEEYNLVMDYAIFSKTKNKIVTIGSSSVVIYDYKNHCKTAVPQKLKEIIATLEKF